MAYFKFNESDCVIGVEDGYKLRNVAQWGRKPTARVTVKFDVMPWEDISVGSKLLALSDGLGVTAGQIYTVNSVDSLGCVEFIDDEADCHTATSMWVLRHVEVRRVTEKGA